MFTFRLVDVDGNDLGPFATSEPNWRPGDRIQRGPDDALEVVRFVDAGDVGVYLVVRRV